MDAQAATVADAASRSSPFRRAVDACIVAYALFHLCTSLLGTYEPLTQRSLFLGAGVGFIFLELAAALWSRARMAAIRDILLALAAIYGGVHVTLHADRFMDIMNDLTVFDMSMGVLMILAALEAARRTIGLSLPLMAVISLAFYLFGTYVISGNWQPPRVSADTAMMTLYASTQGLFGMMADIGTRVVAIYVIFGSLLMAIGAGNVFMQAATLVAGRTFGDRRKSRSSPRRCSAPFPGRRLPTSCRSGRSRSRP